MKITINNKATYRVHLHESYTHPTTHFIPSKNPACLPKPRKII